MTGSEAVKLYLEISDTMYQALKVGKYDIFEEALKERAQVIETLSSSDNIFSSISDETKQVWKSEIEQMDKKIETEMEVFKRKMEAELNELNQNQAKLRKQGSVNKYKGEMNQGQGLRFNQIK